MTGSISGRCGCGAIQYECAAAPMMSFNCHCRDCQRVTGGAFLAAFVVAQDAFRFVQGLPRYNTLKSDKGHVKHYGFCAECGNPVDATIEEHSDIRVVMAGTLDDPSLFKPTMDFFVASAPSWMPMSGTTQKFVTEPDE